MLFGHEQNDPAKRRKRFRRTERSNSRGYIRICSLERAGRANCTTISILFMFHQLKRRRRAAHEAELRIEQNKNFV
ncbi:MAG: hypothetical protein J6M06_01705 [Synergistaceae bacterium]|nr:hypothetical protein [Synergistaceae bacterium]